VTGEKDQDSQAGGSFLNQKGNPGEGTEKLEKRGGSNGGCLHIGCWAQKKEKTVWE